MTVYLPIYNVTKGNTDGSVVKGDTVYYDHTGALILCGKEGGWIDKEELDDSITDFEYEIDGKREVAFNGNRCMFVDKR